MTNSLNNYFQTAFSKYSFDMLPLAVKTGCVLLVEGKTPDPDWLTKDVLCLNIDKCFEILADVSDLLLEMGTLPIGLKRANVSHLFKASKQLS